MCVCVCVCLCACEVSCCSFCCCSVGPFEVCEGVNVTGSKFAPLWGWLPMASYVGSGDFELGSSNVTVDAWGFSLSVRIRVFLYIALALVMRGCYCNVQLV